MELHSPIVAVPGETGSMFSGVFRRLSPLEDMLEAKLVGTQLTMYLHGVPDLAFFAAYDLTVMEDTPLILGRTDKTVLVPMDDDRSFNSRVAEVCAGTGGIGYGCEFLKGQVIASLDSNPLACSQLRLNGRHPVLCLDLEDDVAKGALHQAIGASACALVAGFPCPPHSTQGLGLGAADPRHQALVAIARTTYLLQAHSLILECTPQAQFDSAVRALLNHLCDVMDWQIVDNTLVLSHQRPCRRHRWWAILCPLQWGLANLPKWPVAQDMQCVGELLPFWGCWPESEETDLRLSPAERTAYGNIHYGQDKRLLTLDDRAPTILHSYGSALGPCPCTCRSQGFAPDSLLRKGLRGCYVISELDLSPRYLHPIELGALLGFPAEVDFIQPPRHALCLLGLVASPLQALWTYSALQSASLHLDLNAMVQQAMTALTAFKTKLVQDYAA